MHIFLFILAICQVVSSSGTPEGTISSGAGTYRTVAYFVNWAIYARKFSPQDLPADKLTHVLYAFANINADTGEVYLSDEWADTGVHFPGDVANQTGTSLYGCLNQFYLLKTKNRALRVSLSIGGWTYSANFASPASTASGRATLASSAVTLVQNLGLDGIDIDWEYPADDSQATNMVLLLQALREALDTYGDSLSTPYHFELTVASPAGPSNYEILHLTEMDRYVDFWSIMAYDFAGAWSNATADQANLFPSPQLPASTPFNSQAVVDYYMSQGIVADKIVLGMPIYGRSFASTDGLGKPFNGVNPGTWAPGVYDYKVLPPRGAIETYDNSTGSSYSYDEASRELISYDSPLVAQQKAAWIKQKGLGGAMWWESSADALGNRSLIQTVAEILGGTSRPNMTLNQLLYPDSPYDNLRASASSLSPVSSAESQNGSRALPSVGAIGTSDSSPFTNAPSICACEIRSTLISSLCTTSISEVQSVPLLPSSSTPSTSLLVSASSSSPSNVTLNNTTSSTFEPLTSEVTSSSSEICNTESATAVASQSRDKSTSSTIKPGQDGTPGCAYVLVSDLGNAALCPTDYCNCDGTVAPLLSSSISGQLATNCDYTSQPTANSCPPSTASLSLDTSTVTITTSPPVLTTITSVVWVKASSR